MADEASSPMFSVLTPVFQTPLDLLEQCIASVEGQTCPDWEHLLVDDGNDESLKRWLADRTAGDPRQRVLTADRNLGIARASQLGVERARGAFLALLDHDDLLSPVALERVAERLSCGDVDYVYTDEDKLDSAGSFYEPFFKPDWSPERFRHHMYTCHLSVLRTSLVRQVGGFRSGFDGAQDYDLVLRVTEQARAIEHVAEVLYHWRAHAGSTAGDKDQKPAAQDAGRRAVSDHCGRLGIAAEVLAGPLGSVRVRRAVEGQPLVSLIIPTYGKEVRLRGRQEVLLEHILRNIEAVTTYPNLEYVIVGDTRMDQALVERALSLCSHPVTYVAYEQPTEGFNFSEKVNLAATLAVGEHLLLVNDDIEVLTPEWVEEMLGQSQQPDVGAVGGLYYFEDDTIQHAGVISVLGAYHLLYRHPRGKQVFGHHLVGARECSIVTGACLMVSADLYARVGGFSQSLPNNFNDVDFCLKLRADGYRNIWTPYVEAYHFESQSRVNHVRPYEVDLLRRRWGRRVMSDPYYNPNLQPIEGTWQPHEDWDQVSRSWAAPISDVDDVDVEGYLEVNDDLVLERDRDPDFDVLGHLRDIGMRERRLHVPRRARPAVDRNRRRVRASVEAFSVLGYLEANADLWERARRDPTWDPMEHLLHQGILEGRWMFAEAEPASSSDRAGEPALGRGPGALRHRDRVRRWRDRR